MADFCELSNVDFENSTIKNSFIQSTNGEWLWFVDSDITCKADVEQIIGENAFLSEYDAILFCSEELEGEIGLFDLLAEPRCTFYAFGIKRKLLVKTGSFNRLLEECSNYEFLLRVAEMGTVFAVSCSAAKESVFDSFAMAYVMRRYMGVLKEQGRLDPVFLNMIQAADKAGVLTEFNRCMSDLLQDETGYERVEADTSPILVFVGADKWYGVLQGFANSLAEALVSLGQAVITTNNTYGDYDRIPTEQLLNQYYKAVIGFQASALEKDTFRNMRGIKVQFWFDNPIFFEDFFSNHSKDTYILCQDAYYADYIREYYKIPNAIQFPPGGTVFENSFSEKNMT